MSGENDPNFPSATLSASGVADAPVIDATITSTGAPSSSGDRSSIDEPSQLVAVPSHFYRVEEEVGRGGVGIVVRAHDRRLGRRVALKQLQELGPRSRQRFEREMRITAKLQHPGVVPIHEAGVLDSGAPFYAMKLIEGRSLKELIAERKTMAERLELLPTVVAVVETLAYAHSQGVIHRDIKPSNVIVGSYGETIVIDWGLAKDVKASSDVAPESGPYRNAPADDMTVVGQVVGTPAYMAPEQARGEEVNEAADVYALGALLRQLLTGRPPYDADSASGFLAAVLSGPPRSIDEIATGAPADLRAVIEKAMSREPTSRYPNADGLLTDLRSFLNGRLVSAYSYAASERLRKWAAKRRGVVLTALVALTMLVGLGSLAFIRIVRERDNAVASRRDATDRSNALIREQAGREIDQRNVVRAAEILKSYPRDATDWGKVYPLIHGIETLGLPDFWTFEATKSRIGTFARLDTAGRFILIASGGTIEVWGLSSGRLERAVDVRGGTKASVQVFIVETLGGQPSAIAGMSDGGLIIVRLDAPVMSWKPVRYAACGKSSVNDISALLSRPVVAVGCSDGRAVAVDMQVNEARHLASHASGEANVGFLTDNIVASAAGDGTLKFTALNDGQLKGQLEIGGHTGLMTSGSRCDRMVVGTSDGRLVIVSAGTQQRVSDDYNVDTGYNMRVVGIDDNCRLALGISVQHRMIVVDLLKGRTIYTGPGANAAFYPGRSALVLGTDAGDLEYWDPITDWKQTWRISMLPVSQVMVSRQGTFGGFGDILASFGPARIPRVYQFPQPAITLATQSDESRVALGGASGAVGFFDVEGEFVSETEIVHDGLALVRSDSRGGTYSAGALDGCVYSWQVGEPKKLLTCIPGGIRDIAVADGSIVYVSSRAGSLVEIETAWPNRLRAIRVPSAYRIGIRHPGEGAIVSSTTGNVVFVNAKMEIEKAIAMGTEMNLVATLPSGRVAGVTHSGHIIEFMADGTTVELARCDGQMHRNWAASSRDVFLGACEDGHTVAWPRVLGLDRIVHPDALMDVDGDVNGNVIASCSSVGTVSVVDTAARTVVFMSSNVPFENVELLAEHHLLVASAKKSGLLAVWSLAEQPRPYPLDDRNIYGWLHSIGKD